jgi:hypothetical protein
MGPSPVYPLHFQRSGSDKNDASIILKRMKRLRALISPTLRSSDGFLAEGYEKVV